MFSKEEYNIDYERLRRDLINECHAMYFGGGIGPALITAGEIQNADEAHLLKIAKAMGVSLKKYRQ